MLVSLSPSQGLLVRAAASPRLPQLLVLRGGVQPAAVVVENSTTPLPANASQPSAQSEAPTRQVRVGLALTLTLSLPLTLTLLLPLPPTPNQGTMATIAAGVTLATMVGARSGVTTVAALVTIRAATVGESRWEVGASRVATVVVTPATTGVGASRAAMGAALGMMSLMGGRQQRVRTMVRVHASSRAATDVTVMIVPPSLPTASLRASPALPVSGTWHQRAVATTPTRMLTVAGAKTRVRAGATSSQPQP